MNGWILMLNKTNPCSPKSSSLECKLLQVHIHTDLRHPAITYGCNLQVSTYSRPQRFSFSLSATPKSSEIWRNSDLSRRSELAHNLSVKVLYLPSSAKREKSSAVTSVRTQTHTSTHMHVHTHTQKKKTFVH